MAVSTLANQNVDPIIDYAAKQPKGTPAIDSSVLAPTPTIDYHTPNPTPVYPSSAVDATVPAPLVLTPEEQSVQDNLKKQAELNDQTVGKTAYTQDQERAAGLPGLLDTQKSISKQILALQADAKNIPDI